MRVRDTALLRKLSQRWLVSVSFVLMLLAGTFGFALYSNAGVNDRAAPNTSLSLASLNLIDQDGRKLKRSDLQDRLVLMNFFFTSCGSACPVQTAVLREVTENLDQSVDVLFLSISIAPLSDTPDAIDHYLEKYEIHRDNWKFVTASVENTAELVQRFAVTLDNAVVKDDLIDHRNMGYLFGKSGALMQQYQLIPGMSKRLIREIAELSVLEPQA